MFRFTEFHTDVPLGAGKPDTGLQDGDGSSGESAGAEGAEPTPGSSGFRGHVGAVQRIGEEKTGARAGGG